MHLVDRAAVIIGNGALAQPARPLASSALAMASSTLWPFLRENGLAMAPIGERHRSPAGRFQIADSFDGRARKRIT